VKQVLTVSAMRDMDAKTIAAGTPGRVLMGRAAEGIFRAVRWQGPAAILCGTGNNAGDGYALALLLQRAGIPVKLLRLSERFSEDGRYYYEKCLAAGIPDGMYRDEGDLSGCRELVDCIFGTGFHGAPEGLSRDCIEAMNRAGARVIAADIPSGLSGLSGRGETVVKADITVSIGWTQPGHYLAQAKDYVGTLVNADIGIPAGSAVLHLCEDGDLRKLCPPRPCDCNKGSFGYVALLGGCMEYSGAAKLANLSMAALRCGCGVSTLAVPGCIAASVSPYLLESTLLPLPDWDGFAAFDPASLDEVMRRRKALGVGMGWGAGPDNEAILTYILQHYTGNLILDADGLNTLSRLEPALLRESKANIVLTPHLREFSRLTGLSEGEILSDPVSAAERYARENRVIVLLKGAATVVTDGEQTYLTDAGCPGMATAGSGDVLTGILTGLLGWAAYCPETAALGAHLNGRAGELAQDAIGAVSMTAGDTVKFIPRVMHPGKEKDMTYFKRIPMETLVNTRDLGGWPTKDGKVTKYGVIYRTDCPIGISENDKAELLRRGVTLSIDLRGCDEVEDKPSGLANVPGHTYIHCPISEEHRIIKSDGDKKSPPPPPPAGSTFDLGDTYVGMLEMGKPWAKKVIELLANWEGAAIFHCFIGKDRAGLIAALTLGAVGVCDTDIIADYSWSMSFLRPKFLKMGGSEHLPQKHGRPDFSAGFFGSVPETMETALCHMNEKYGGVVGYLKDCGVADETIQKLRDKMLENV